MIRIAWHGGPSFSLDLDGLEVLVDPSFSRVGDYPPWFDEGCVNHNSPGIDTYLEHYRPEYLFITHGHFDHFCLVTVRRLTAALGVRVVGTPEVIRTCREVLSIPPERLSPCPASPGQAWLSLREAPSGAAEALGGNQAPVRVRALPGPHWFTGEDADVIAARLSSRPELYGAMPCGGPMFGYLFDVGGATVFAGGDTEDPGFPPGPFDAAIVSCGGELINPATKEREGPFLGETALARVAATVLRPRVLVPVHHDHPVFLTRFDAARLQGELERYPAPPRLLPLEHNAWTTLLD